MLSLLGPRSHMPRLQHIIITKRGSVPPKGSNAMGSFPLSLLPPYGVCRVERVEPSPARERLFGLGVNRGAVMVRLFEAPCGDPTAFSVRGTVVALRRSDCERIIVSEVGKWV